MVHEPFDDHEGEPGSESELLVAVHIMINLGLRLHHQAGNLNLNAIIGSASELTGTVTVARASRCGEACEQCTLTYRDDDIDKF
eukprot:2429710-Rhodomonas_salina.1